MSEINEIPFQEDMELNVFCPHPDCGGGLIISSKECGIIIHAQNKETKQQIDPHASKAECEKLIQEEKIFGCGKPFFVERNTVSGKITTTIRDYER